MSLFLSTACAYSRLYSNFQMKVSISEKQHYNTYSQDMFPTLARAGIREFTECSHRTSSRACAYNDTVSTIQLHSYHCYDPNNDENNGNDCYNPNNNNYCNSINTCTVLMAMQHELRQQQQNKQEQHIRS